MMEGSRAIGPCYALGRNALGRALPLVLWVYRFAPGFRILHQRDYFSTFSQTIQHLACALFNESQGQMRMRPGNRKQRAVKGQVQAQDSRQAVGVAGSSAAKGAKLGRGSGDPEQKHPAGSPWNVASDKIIQALNRECRQRVRQALG